MRFSHAYRLSHDYSTTMAHDCHDFDDYDDYQRSSTFGKIIDFHDFHDFYDFQVLSTITTIEKEKPGVVVAPGIFSATFGRLPVVAGRFAVAAGQMLLVVTHEAM